MSEKETRHAFNPKFRKRRKYQGASWTPRNQSAELGDGAWCPNCRTRHGYMNSLDIAYDKDGQGRWIILWRCKKTGVVCEQMTLG